MERIKGLIDAPFTPFYENGEVNLEPIEAYAKMLVKNGLQGVFINGSSGEGYMLTEEERMRLAERWVSVAPEGFKVIVHVGSCCVKASRMLAEHAQKIGAWGIGAMAPPFPKIGRIEELVKYIEEIAAGAPELPFYYYHIPAFNGAFLPMVKLLEAVDGRVPNFAGIKYTFESMYEYNQCRLYKNGKFINEGFGKDVLGDPAIAVRWLAEYLDKFDISLNKGDIILSGAFSAAVPASPEDTFVCRFGNLCEMELRFN